MTWKFQSGYFKTVSSWREDTLEANVKAGSIASIDVNMAQKLPVPGSAFIPSKSRAIIVGT